MLCHNWGTTARSLALVAAFSLGLSQAAMADAGTVVLENTPGCDHFVVETPMGFSLLEWYGGVVSVWPGDIVNGELHSYGMKTVQVVGRGDMSVWIDDYMVSRDSAIEHFRSKCD